MDESECDIPESIKLLIEGIHKDELAVPAEFMRTVGRIKEKGYDQEADWLRDNREAYTLLYVPVVVTKKRRYGERDDVPTTC
jgi:hypothetical protein